MHKNSLLLIVSIAIAVLVGLYTGYGFVERSSLKEDFQTKERQLLGLKDEFVQLEEENVIQAIAAKQTLNELSNNIVRWSQIIEKIRDTIPTDDENRPIVDILSYSGSGENEISVNVKTVNVSEEPYFDVADLIAAFDDNKYFEDVFTSSISKGKDIEGVQVLSFTITMKYVSPASIKSVPESASETEVKTNLEDFINETPAEVSTSEDSEESDASEEEKETSRGGSVLRQ